jgi:hypothetical protein
MKLKVIRKEFTDLSTIGELSVNGVFECFTLEDKVRDFKADGTGKVYGKTAIPKGNYEVVLTYSNRFKQVMPLLLNVPYFEGIRIHPGNKNEDTHGCLLVGNAKSKDLISNSKVAYQKLLARIKAVSKFEKVFIEIA